LIVLGDFNFDILLDPEHSATSRYRDILDSLSISFFPVTPVVTRPVSGTCIDHVLTKFPEKVVSFGTRFSAALSEHCILTFSYCIRPPPPVDRLFVSYKDTLSSKGMYPISAVFSMLTNDLCSFVLVFQSFISMLIICRFICLEGFE
jgi:hypothetical protein